MKCCCECHCGGIPSRDALNDRLYWVEVLIGPYRGEKAAAWRDCPDGPNQWLVSSESPLSRLVYSDAGIRIIHEIIPED